MKKHEIIAIIGFSCVLIAVQSKAMDQQEALKEELLKRLEGISQKKEQFYDNIKYWNNINNKIESLQNDLNNLKIKKNTVKNNIISYVQDNNLNNAVIKIDNNQLRFISCKTFQPLTYKFLKQCLTDCITNNDQVDLLFEYIKQQRSINEYLDIKVSK